MDVIAQVQYDKIREIGGIAGKNSRVFLAFDHHLHTELVVKEIEKARISDPARYFDEARAFHASAHPRVVTVHWAADRTDHVCIAMPLMVGGSLADAIETTPLAPSRLIQVAQDLCEGVAQVHLAKFVHMDIKPTNVLFDANGRAAITDFGQALPLDTLGTADARGHRIYQSFTPPEIARSGAVATAASDVYTTGIPSWISQTRPCGACVRTAGPTSWSYGRACSQTFESRSGPPEVRAEGARPPKRGRKACGRHASSTRH